jgi:hypothetical protein
MLDGAELLSPQYRDATRTAFWIQVPIAVVCFLMLDSGVTARYCGTAMLGFWLGMAFIAARRPWTPTENDLHYLRWGFIPMFVAVRFVGVIIWNQ